MNIQYCDGTKAAIRLTFKEVAGIKSLLELVSHEDAHLKNEFAKLYEMMKQEQIADTDLET